MKVFVPSAYRNFTTTCPCPRYRQVILQLAENGVVEPCNKKYIKCAHSIFGVYKDSTQCRLVYDMSPLTEFPAYKTPPFALPNAHRVLAEVGRREVAIKLDLSNGFYHILGMIRLYPSTLRDGVISKSSARDRTTASNASLWDGAGPPS